MTQTSELMVFEPFGTVHPGQYRDAKSLMATLNRKGVEFSDSTWELLRFLSFEPYGRNEQVELVQTTPALLGFNLDQTRYRRDRPPIPPEELYPAAAKSGLVPCPLEVGFLLCLRASLKNIGDESLHVAIETVVRNSRNVNSLQLVYTDHPVVHADLGLKPTRLPYHNYVSADELLSANELLNQRWVFTNRK